MFFLQLWLFSFYRAGGVLLVTCTHATVTVTLARLSCLSRGEILPFISSNFTLPTPPEQITSDLQGHSANPPLNGNTVRVKLPLSFKLAAQMDS